ncbi:MAG: SMC-Scp complex subunit ScpB [Acidimicrobiia bacterium]|nr:SMC-Scp complex subunit ScpB [Acidimicrobiia bacterium]
MKEPLPERDIDLTDHDHLARLSRGIEALVMVAGDPIPDAQLAHCLGTDEVTIRAICVALSDSYEDQRRGFQLAYVAGGWRFQSHPDLSDLITGYVTEGQNQKLSPAAMETLAIIAYKQPISRAQIGAIRGVNVDGVLRTLSQRGYVAEIGRDEGPGQAVLFGTTQLFCESLGIASARDLPALGEFVPPAHVVEALEQTLMAEPVEPTASG